MKVNFDQLEQMNQAAEETAEAAQEATGEAAEGGHIESTARTAMEEFVAQEKARQELVETINEQKEPSGFEALADVAKEALGDPEMRKAIKQYLTGESAFSDPEIQQKHEPQPFAPNEPQNPPEIEGQTDGGKQGYHLTTEQVATIMESVLNDMANLQPEMTAEEMADKASENREMIIPELEKMLNDATE